MDEYGRRASDTKLHERMATVEAQQSAMSEGIATLNTSITSLNTKIDTVTNRISTAAGIFASVVFFTEFVLIPFLFIVFKQYIK